MANNIVLCLDGTGNQIKATGTSNVVNLYEMLDLSDPDRQAGLGDVLRRLRRQALHDGYPMVLSIVAYGDADWRVAS